MRKAKPTGFAIWIVKGNLVNDPMSMAKQIIKAFSVQTFVGVKLQILLRRWMICVSN